MLLSLITGTYNRLESLKRLLQSVALSVPQSISYEMVICDGGSTDGTLGYLEEIQRQSGNTIKVIKHGELRGAIAAFNDAARAATGDYVLVANDDIEIQGLSVTRALAYLMDNPDCGAVAFFQDRGGKEMHVETMPMKRPDGKEIQIPYMQVGVMPRWLWNDCGGWGAWGGRTYGGDNYLTKCILERGYRVMPLEGCSIKDFTIEDDLRRRNNSENTDGKLFWDTFGHATIAAAPTIASPLERRERVLYAPIIEAGHDIQKQLKRGLRDALGVLGEVAEVDYVYSREDILAMAEAWRPQYILTQFHEADAKRVELAKALRKIRGKWMVNFDGDVWAHSQTDPNYLEMLREFDCQLFVNESLNELYKAKGIRAAYWQNAWEPQIVGEGTEDPCDVVFLGNNYSEYRATLARALKSLPFNVHIYGSGYDGTGVEPQGQSLYDYAKTGRIYRGARIAIADNQFFDAIGFASDRMFMALAAGGCMLLHQRVQKMDELLGLVDGVHYVAWDSAEDRDQKIAYYLEHEDERARIAAAGTEECRKNHSFERRVEQLGPLIAALAIRRRRISVCMIVRDEVENLKRIMPQLGFADEVVIVDTGSVDGTVPYLRSQSEVPDGVQSRIFIYSMEWKDFSTCRNFAKSKCTMEWIMWLDADDDLAPGLQEWLPKLDAWKPESCQAFKIPCLDTSSQQFQMQTRLFQNLPGVEWRSEGHETVDDSLRELGIRPVGYKSLDIAVLHRGNADPAAVDRKQLRNLRILQGMKPGAWRSLQMASSFAAMGLWEAATSLAEIAALDDQLRGFARFLAGFCHFQAGNTESAEWNLSRSEFVDAKYLLAEIRHASGETDPAAYLEYLKSEIPVHFPSFSTIWKPIAKQRVQEWIEQAQKNIV